MTTESATTWPATPEPQQRAEAGEGRVTTTRQTDDKSATNRVLRFARRHPALTVVGAGGAALIGGLELAAGVLIGAGVTALVRAKNAGRDRPSNGGTAKATEAATEATEAGARDMRERARAVLGQTPEVMRKRARAVVQAARGKLEPVA